MTRIVSIATQQVPIPLPAPVVPQGGTLTFRRLDNLVVHVGTDDGGQGSAYVWLPGSGAGPGDPPVPAQRAVEELVHGLGAALIGADVFSHEQLWKAMATRVEHHGRGLLSLAHSGLDMAMWDAALKSVGLPLHRALGSPTQGTGCYSNQLLDYWDADLAELAAAAKRIVADGFTCLKMPAGMHPREADDWDLHRVAAVREAIGPEIGLMVDVGCRWRADQVAMLAPRLHEFALRWLEDPLPLSQPEGLRQLRSRIGTPIATGENSFDLGQLHDLVRRGAVDVVIYEPMRVGGITGSVKLAHMAELYGVPIAPHTYPDLAAQLMPAAATGALCEYLEWWRPLLTNPVDPDHGRMAPTTGPGIGLDMRPEFLESFATRVTRG
ncbi:MAG TPA: mandelate racemase/muconate lactonizing enzyme family protein [Micromonosporaceae bacterium]